MMTTALAKSLLVRDRLDWTQPRGTWIARAFYARRFPRKHDHHPQDGTPRRAAVQKV